MQDSRQQHNIQLIPYENYYPWYYHINNETMFMYATYIEHCSQSSEEPSYMP